MKSKGSILKRLVKVKNIYLNQYIEERISRKFDNCDHSYWHTPSPIPQKPSHKNKEEMYPSHTVTLLVIPDKQDPIPLCMYNSENPNKWKGDLCLGDTPKSCPYFKNKHDINTVKNDFEELLKDDLFVAKHMKEIAILQWVLDVRLHSKFGFIHNLIFLFSYLRIKFIEKIKFMFNFSRKHIIDRRDFWDDIS